MRSRRCFAHVYSFCFSSASPGTTASGRAFLCFVPSTLGLRHCRCGQTRPSLLNVVTGFRLLYAFVFGRKGRHKICPEEREGTNRAWLRYYHTATLCVVQCRSTSVRSNDDSSSTAQHSNSNSNNSIATVSMCNRVMSCQQSIPSVLLVLHLRECCHCLVPYIHRLAYFIQYAISYSMLAHGQELTR